MPRRNPFLTIIVTGVPGVGKTTVLRLTAKMLEEKGVNHVILNYGDYMLATAKRRGLAENRDQLRHLPLRVQLELQEEAAKTLVSEAGRKLGGRPGVLIIDTHAAIRTDTGYWPGLPEHIIKSFNPDSIVVIEAKPEEILSRQLRDSTRYRRDLARIEEIARLMSMARTAAMASAVLTASSVYIVENREGEPEKAAEEIIKLIERLT